MPTARVLLMKRFLLTLTTAVVLSGVAPQTVRAALPPLIPRAVLFGNPVKTLPTISPDGKRLAYLAPDAHGVLAIWVRTLGKSDDRVIASDPVRPIRNVFWQPDSRHVLYGQDKNGDENFHVYSADILTKRASVDLTPYPGVRAGIDTIDPRYPTVALIDMNKRDKTVFDVYRVDLTNGTSTLDTQNPGNVQGWVADNKLQIRAGLVQNADGSSTVIVRDAPNAAWRTLVSYSADDGFASPQAFSPDGSALYVVAAGGANAARLLRYDLKSGTPTVVTADPTYDVGGVLVDPKSRKVIAANITRERSDWQVLDPSYESDFATLKALHAGDITFTSASGDGRKVIVSYLVDDGPVSFYSYDRDTKKGTFLFTSRPELAKYTLAHMQPISYTARDGTTIHGYLTLPVGLEPKGLPMVEFVHGGPWDRDSWGYSAYPQWLANRGYAVLQPNFRGSTGYGKDFLNKGDRQWAGTMHTDLLDAKAWAIAQGYADPKRVAIMGGSYGGYATLAALTFSPDAFACGVDIVGPSNLNTLLASIPPYWATARAQFARRMGDTVEFLNSQSPLFKADKIQAPLLIGQGANDPRVNIRESDQIVAAMRKGNKPVEYVVFPDEGHGFARPENNRRFNAAAEAFLAKYLNGRADPAGPDESITAFLK